MTCAGARGFATVGFAFVCEFRQRGAQAVVIFEGHELEALLQRLAQRAHELRLKDANSGKAAKEEDFWKWPELLEFDAFSHGESGCNV